MREQERDIKAEQQSKKRVNEVTRPLYGHQHSHKQTREGNCFRSDSGPKKNWPFSVAWGVLLGFSITGCGEPGLNQESQEIDWLLVYGDSLSQS
jgi:hypothetical protein